MKTHVIIGALLLSTLLITAQTANKKTTIRVKKVENINGVEKMTDTIYTIDGPVKLSSLEEIGGEENAKSKDGKQKKIVIVTDQVDSDNVTIINKDGEMDDQVQRALKAAGVDGKTLDVDKMMVVNTDGKDIDENGKQATKIIIIKTIKITDPTSEDAKMLNKQTGVVDNKLAVDKMNFYPNPSTGKFNLNFNLNAKGNTEITILNMEGKSIYNEELKDFTGNYDKEIDISTNPKGVYFVKIKQGSHAQLKKIVLE